MKILPEDVGRKVWDFLKQEWAIVQYVGTDDQTLPVQLRYCNGDIEHFDLEGKLFTRDKHAALFWEEVKPIEHQERPKEKVKNYQVLYKYYRGTPRISYDFFKDKEDFIKNSHDSCEFIGILNYPETTREFEE